MRKYRNTLTLFVCLLAIDLIFYQISFPSFYLPAFGRMLLCDGCLSILMGWLTSHLSHKAETILSFLFVLFFAIYAYVELEFKNFIETYYSLQALADGGFRVQTFVVYFIKTAKWFYYLSFIPAICYLIFRKTDSDSYRLPFSFLFSAILLSILLLCSFTFDHGALKEAVTNQDNFDTIIANTGINTFLLEDISSLFIKRENTAIQLEEESIAEEEIKVEIPKEETEEEPFEETSFRKREFDDSEWRSDYENETNENIKTIDAYLMNRTIEDKNEMTGIFEGYNCIYFLVESLDYVGIDETLTPTIWKMMQEGYFFSHHYTPVFSCGTGDSEFAAMTSMMPYGSSCTVYSVTRNNLQNSLAGLFKRAGYSTYGFHNWNDEFYNRTELSESYGMDSYLDIDDLDFKLVKGWQSDSILAEKALPYFVNDEHFFTFFVTSTMHWPYDVDSYYGNAYMQEINAVHPDYPIELKRYISKTMEFDKMLETLISGLEKAGQLDNTVFCFWPDHHPFNLSNSVIRKYTTIVDRYQDYGFYMSPLVIYCASASGEEITNVCSTFDHLPTIANLFDLNYDPRLYIGSDIFNNQCRVIMTNGDWISNLGIHVNSKNSFVPFVEDADEEEVNRITAEVKNIIKVGRAMVSNNYFDKRPYLIDPKPK